MELPSMAFDYVAFSAEFPWFFPIAAFLFGAIVGSFLNVCIYRIPAGKSIVRPGSQCACGQPIAPYDNIPIFSWLILRGRARCCGRPYSIRYPLIELLTAGLFLACWMMFPPVKALCGMLFCSCLICATFIDLDTMEIPDRFSVGLAIAGFILSICFPQLHDQNHELFVVASMRSLVISLQGMFIGAGLVVWISVLGYTILKKEAMGFGDVKLVGGIGAFCGWQGTVTAVFGGAILGSLWFVGALLWQLFSGKKMMFKSPEEGEAPAELSLQTYIPFGPMIVLAGILHFLYFHRLVDAYFAEIATLL